MPELPEVECVRRSLERLVVGRRVEAVRVNRGDVIVGKAGPKALLVGDRIARVLRHGKQLAIVGEDGGCVSVHLGMSGQLCVMPPPGDERPVSQRTKGRSGSLKVTSLPAHTHVLWSLGDGLMIRFTDPRRFGGLWTFAHLDELKAERWAQLGPDALKIGPAQLANALSKTTRSLKAALLDQALVAGLGNIYVDELLYNARVHPLLPANALPKEKVPGLVRRMRTLLNGAIERGGSSLRDYVDADNQQGTQQHHHKVYGRVGLRCRRRGCWGSIESEQVAGRTTAWCPDCQILPSGTGLVHQCLSE